MKNLIFLFFRILSDFSSLRVLLQPLQDANAKNVDQVHHKSLEATDAYFRYRRELAASVRENGGWLLEETELLLMQLYLQKSTYNPLTNEFCSRKLCECT